MRIVVGTGCHHRPRHPAGVREGLPSPAASCGHFNTGSVDGHDRRDLRPRPHGNGSNGPSELLLAGSGGGDLRLSLPCGLVPRSADAYDAENNGWEDSCEEGADVTGAGWWGVE